MTDRELIQAMRVCEEMPGCAGCVFDGDCFNRAADRLEALMAENERLNIELQAMRNAANGYKKMIPRWVSVDERLPENDERVLALCQDGVIHDMRWNYPRWAWLDRMTGCAYFEQFCTNWMPPPSTEGWSE